MSGQYSHKQFFRRTPIELLARYFAAKDIDLGVNFEELKTKKEDSIFEAFLNLPEHQQAEIETEFQDVNAMACEAGVAALIDEAIFHEDKDFTGAIAEIDGFHAKAMWAFVEKNNYWRGAARFLHADNVSVLSWKKRNDLPKVATHIGNEDIEALAKAISAFFYKKEGRGRNCKVEPYNRHNKKYFFAYPEDFGQSGIEWISDTLKTRARHPAFEIIFVYCEEDGSLDIYAPKNTKSVPELQNIFTKTILKLDVLDDGAIDQRVYELASMANPDFEFQIEPESGVSCVVITRLRLTLKDSLKRRVVVEADTKKNPKAVYDLLK